MRLRRGRRDQEEADQDQAKILKVSLYIYIYKTSVLKFAVRLLTFLIAVCMD